jgi:hypothetical protein
MDRSRNGATESSNLLSSEDLDFLSDMLRDEPDDFFLRKPIMTIKKIGSFHAEPILSRKPSMISPRSPVRGGERAKKCTECYLGGPAIRPGMTVFPDEPCFCSNLSCLSCDHVVVRFQDSRWKKETNYLFLRNNYPDKVEKNLYKAPGWCAFCCQCTFREEEKLTRLSPYASNWVCRGHK